MSGWNLWDPVISSEFMKLNFNFFSFRLQIFQRVYLFLFFVCVWFLCWIWMCRGILRFSFKNNFFMKFKRFTMTWASEKYGSFQWKSKVIILFSTYMQLPGSLHNSNLLSYSSGSQKSEIEVLAGLVPSEAIRETLFQDSRWLRWCSGNLSHLRPILLMPVFIFIWSYPCVNVCLCPHFLFL